MKAKCFLSALIVILLSVYVHSQHSEVNINGSNKNKVGVKQANDTAKSIVNIDSSDSNTVEVIQGTENPINDKGQTEETGSFLNNLTIFQTIIGILVGITVIVAFFIKMRKKK